MRHSATLRAHPDEETTSMPIDGHISRPVLAFERTSPMPSERPKSRPPPSPPPLKLSANLPISAGFLQKLQYLADKHPHGLDVLESTADKLIASYKLADTVLLVFAWSTLFAVG
jgi:hypothetical protein